MGSSKNINTGSISIIQTEPDMFKNVCVHVCANEYVYTKRDRHTYAIAIKNY